MMSHRRYWLALFLAWAACTSVRADGQSLPYTPVITPNGATLPWKMVNGAKEFHLVVEPIEWEMAPGMIIKAWGYNGRTPGPTIEAVEGDRVRILVTNKLGEGTAVHWHGILLPPGMDGVQGITQPSIPPGDTFAYEFTLKQHGTHMYHSHGDELVQIGLGTMGFFIIHPRERAQKIDRDYAIFLNEWRVDPGTDRPNPSEMTEFNMFTFNSRVYPGTAPLVARRGERVRIRVGHVGQDFHAIHLHGHQFPIVATDGGDVPPSAQMPETTIAIGPGQTRDVEFIATDGDWPMHCHLRHHPMNAMGHEMPNMIGVSQRGTERKIQALIPGYMAMGQHGMEEMTHMQGMPGPRNTLPMMTANDAPFGSSGMGGMFTLLKVHDDIPSFPTMEAYARRVQLPVDLGWYKHPPGTVAASIHKGRRRATPAAQGHQHHSPVKPDEAPEPPPGLSEPPSDRRERRREPSTPPTGHEQHGGSGAGSHSGH